MSILQRGIYMAWLFPLPIRPRYVQYTNSNLKWTREQRRKKKNGNKSSNNNFSKSNNPSFEHSVCLALPCLALRTHTQHRRPSWRGFNEIESFAALTHSTTHPCCLFNSHIIPQSSPRARLVIIITRCKCIVAPLQSVASRSCVFIYFPLAFVCVHNVRRRHCVGVWVWECTVHCCSAVVVSNYELNYMQNGFCPWQTHFVLDVRCALSVDSCMQETFVDEEWFVFFCVFVFEFSFSMSLTFSAVCLCVYMLRSAVASVASSAVCSWRIVVGCDG